MTSHTNNKELIESRSVLYGRAFEDRSADEIASWFSESMEYNDIAMDEWNMDKSATHSFFTGTTSRMSNLTIVDQTTHGETPEFVVWEMLLTVTMNDDEPEMGLKKGQTTTVRGTALQWWRWEGEGEQWDGDLSETRKGIRGWKIVKENDYMIPLKKDSQGRSARI